MAWTGAFQVLPEVVVMADTKLPCSTRSRQDRQKLPHIHTARQRAIRRYQIVLPETSQFAVKREGNKTRQDRRGKAGDSRREARSRTEERG